MKANVIRMVLAMSVACISGSVLHAQTKNLSVNIPFAFHVDDKVFPQGKYQVGEYGDTHIQALLGATGGVKIFIRGAYPSLDPVRPGRVVFRCYSGTCFLAEVWPRTGNGNAVPPSKIERSIRDQDPMREAAMRKVVIYPAD